MTRQHGQKQQLHAQHSTYPTHLLVSTHTLASAADNYNYTHSAARNLRTCWPRPTLWPSQRPLGRLSRGRPSRCTRTRCCSVLTRQTRRHRVQPLPRMTRVPSRRAVCARAASRGKRKKSKWIRTKAKDGNGCWLTKIKSVCVGCCGKLVILSTTCAIDGNTGQRSGGWRAASPKTCVC